MGLVNRPQAEAPYQGTVIRSQINNAPLVYGANATYSPLYTQLDEQNMNLFLNGANGHGGFLDEYADHILPALTNSQTAANTATRTANLNDAAALTPQYIANERAGNPQGADLLDQLSHSASQELGYGTQLTPAEQLQMQQSVRGGQAARGMGNGPSDVFSESMANTDIGQQLLTRRQGAAEGVLPQLDAFYGNPTAAISGMGSNAGLNAGGVAGVAGSLLGPAQSSEFNPADSENTLMMQQEFQGSYGEDQGAGQSLTSMSGGSSKL